MKPFFVAIFLASTFLGMAQAQEHVIDQKTIDVSFSPEELSLTCRMGLNGLSYISLNSPTLYEALKANVKLEQTETPILHLTSPFTSGSTDCQETNRELVQFIVASGSKATAHLKLSLVESTTTSFDITSRVLRENVVLELNDHPKFYNEGTVILEQKAVNPTKSNHLF